MNSQNVFKRWESWWWGCLLAVVVLALYAPALRFGLIWDDPRFYASGMTQSSLWQVLTSPQPPTFQFYRPVAVLYNRLFVSPEGMVNAPLAHALQIGMHLVATLISVPILRAFKFNPAHARLTALCFAIFPFSFQAVAWQQNQQPLVLFWVLLSVLAAVGFRQRRSLVWLGLSLVAYALALLVQEGAVLFVVVFFWLAVTDRQVFRLQERVWPLLHLGLALTYVWIWLSMPHQSSVTGQGFQIKSAGYLLQGVVFPVARLMGGTASNWPLGVLMGLFVALGLLLVPGVWKWESAQVAVLCATWIAVGLLPVWGGLASWYVLSGPRLFYAASLGIAGLWGGWAAWAFSSRQPRWRRWVGGLALVLVLTVSLQQWWQFCKLYREGTQHLARAVQLLEAAPDGRLLFVNFPDHIEVYPRPYPIGTVDLILAPVVQNLSDYARAEAGRSGEDRSLSAFLAGADERGAWPYYVDMRGEDTSPEGLVQAALWADAVYLTHYLPGGRLDLQQVGDVRPAQSPVTPIAAWEDSVQLVGAEVSVSASRVLTLRLVWRCLKPLREHDTIFVHFWQNGAFRASADGDSLGTLVPLYAWQVGTDIVDVRYVDVSDFEPGRYQVRVGIYNRVDRTRYPVRGIDGARFPEDEAPAQTFVLP
jgi:hypothetical protein